MKSGRRMLATPESPAWLARLNADQRAAVEHGADAGPLLVIAGAGSGKTDTLAHRVAHLVASGADPGRILLLTFSRRAAAEMAGRAERIVAGLPGGRSSGRLAWAGTFHGVGARLLRLYADAIGLSPGFTILDREDAADLMGLVRHELGHSGRESRFPLKATCLAIYSRAINAGLPLGELLQTAFPWCAMWADELKAMFAAYVDAKQRQGVLDYDDLLLCWAQMMGDAALAADVGARFDHVLVDEYQDTNSLQATIL
ncbi:MAG: UvrD-helicase domain-containing protein, partial [Alphaproteobacteria bacterium]